jgi:dTDP-glucose 4,6-dehydratase
MLRYALNSNKIKSELGWYPKTAFSKGINLTLNWYLKINLTINQFQKKIL